MVYIHYDMKVNLTNGFNDEEIKLVDLHLWCRGPSGAYTPHTDWRLTPPAAISAQATGSFEQFTHAGINYEEAAEDKSRDNDISAGGYAIYSCQYGTMKILWELPNKHDPSTWDPQGMFIGEDHSFTGRWTTWDNAYSDAEATGCFAYSNPWLTPIG
jgi:hypothetical protein